MWFFLIFFSLISFVSAFADTPAELYSRAESRYKKGSYELSLKLYRDLVREYPLSQYVPEAAFRIGVIQVYTGDYAGAEKSFNDIEKRYGYRGFSRDIPFWKGIIHYRKGEFQEAEKQFEQYLQSGKREYLKEAVVYKARSEYELSEISRAVETVSVLKGSIYTFEEDPSLFSFYLYLLEQNGNYSDVISLSSTVQIDTWKGLYRDRVKLSLAESLYKTGDTQKARELYESIISSTPDIASVALIRLFTLSKGDVEKQKEILSKAQLVLSGYPDLINNFYIHIGIESYKRGDYGVAGAYLSRVWNSRKEKPVNYLVPLYLALLKGAEKDYSGGEVYLRTFLKEGGERKEEILYTLSDLCLKDEDWDCAVELLPDMLNSFPESKLYSRTSWMYAYALYRKGSYRESLTVIDSVTSSGKGGTLQDSLIRLKIKNLMKRGRKSEAVSLLEEYIPLHPDNMNARLDYIILSFQLSDYRNLLEMYKNMKSSPAVLLKGNSKSFLLSSYIAGITMIGEKRSREGIALLGSIDKKYLLENDLESIYPYIAYYTGWAYYSMSDYSGAEKWFSEVIGEYTDSPLYADALYLAGWASYLQQDFAKAADFFAQYSKHAEAADRGRGAYYYGKSMLADGRPEEAELIFQNIYTSFPKDSYADDALYRHAQILEQLGQTEEAVLLYERLFKDYPRSVLAEEGMYKIGELYFKKGDYTQARLSFYKYRSRYPSGKLVDASLYWGGLCALKLEERYGALLLWEKLVNNYPDSSFRSEVLRETASIYSDEGEYGKALEYYSEYMLSYPDETEASSVKREIEKLKLLASGLGEREATLLVAIEDKTLKKKEGREAAIELASLYLYNDKNKWENALSLLNKVAAMRETDADTAGRAQYYIGEYYSKKHLYADAVKAFIKAASMNPSDRDLAAISLYRAAENAGYAGDKTSAEKMVNLLNLKFPTSQWSLEGTKLLEGLNR